MMLVVSGIRSRCTPRSFSYTPFERVSVALKAARTNAWSAAVPEVDAPKYREYSPLQDCARRRVLIWPALDIRASEEPIFDFHSEKSCCSSVVQAHGSSPAFR